MAHPQTSFVQTELTRGSFLERKRQIVWEKTLIYQLEVLKKTGRYDAFKLKWHSSYNNDPDHWPVPNHLFWDSDVAKWIEGACYFLHAQRSGAIEAAIDELVHMIRGAQHADGYLNIHFTVVAPKERFTNIRDFHELYNAGHLIEAAVAHYRLYKNRQLLDPIIKYVDLLHHTFGPGPHQKHGYPGHPEIELALLRLYEVTQEPRHLMLAEYFIDERGNPNGVNGKHFYTVEAELRGERLHERPSFYPYPQCYWYQQADKPIIEQDTIQGHSVRAMYLLTAVADLERYRHREGYRSALMRLWRNMVEKKMYLTGGIGAIKQWEGFGINYFLPQSTDEGGCFNETCAAIGVMMLAERLLQIDLNGQYGDIMELCFYNAVLTAMSCDGRTFAYTNQLASSGSDLSERSKWFTTSCCPPNISRTLGFLAGYMWSHNVEDTSAHIKVHMFGSARLDFAVGEHTVELIQQSNWPWEGHIAMELKGSEKVQTRLSLRIPAWASKWEISPRPPRIKPEKGYLHLPADWLQKNPKFSLHIPIAARLLVPHPFTNMEITAVARGPLIYCLEDVDNTWVDDHFRTLTFDPSSPISGSTKTDAETGETYIMLTASGPFPFLDVNDLSLSPGVISNVTGQKKANFVDELYFIPYYYRANRGGKGHMRVGLRKTSANRTTFFS